MTLHFVESGKGPAVVLLHAFPMDSLLWAPVRKALAARELHVVTPDLPGFGGSPLPTEEPSLDVVADEVARLMDHLMLDQAVIGGLSMGGYVAMAMLRKHPERVRGLILVDTKASADSPEARDARLAMASAVGQIGMSAIAPGMLDNLLGATTHASRPNVVNGVRRWICAQSPSAVAWAQRAMAARPDSLPDLAAFAGPALILVGQEDTMTGIEAATAMAQACPSSTLIEIPAVGHLSAVEDPTAVSEALASWLAKL